MGGKTVESGTAAGDRGADEGGLASGPVLVTGANGYLASWLVKRLLERDCEVRGTVRDPADARKTEHLWRAAGAAPGRLSLTAADLLTPGSFDAAMAGCHLVFHTASPFIARGLRDPRRQVIEPVIDGTRNVLDAANRTASVRRVVLTSSVAAVYGDARDLAATDAGRFDERCWNTSSTERHQPYSYAKAAAERLAWQVSESQDRWDLVTLNPGLVLGPALSPHAGSESVAILRDFASGLYRLGAPALEFGVVDVRDVAEAHLRAGLGSSAAGRHLLVAGTLSLLEIGRILRDAFGSGYPFPPRILPTPFVRLLAPLTGVSQAFVSRNVGYPLAFDSGRAERELGMAFRPAGQAVLDHFRQLLDDGLVVERPHPAGR